MSDSSSKRLVIGVDEAGYGPNLGPLLICGSAWLAPVAMEEFELVAAFSDVFQAKAFNSLDCNHIPLGDSKKLYQPRLGLASLEMGLLPLLTLIQAPRDSQGIDSVEALLVQCTEFCERPGELPWYYALERLAVPQDAATEPNRQVKLQACTRLAKLAADALGSMGVELLDMHGIIITEPYFNRRVAELGSKGQLLTLTSLTMVSNLLAKYRGYPSYVYCDRQGGRRNYLPALFNTLPDTWFVETQNSRQRCSYRGTGALPCDIHFSVGGDSFPATALASMLAKYLRERLMESFNDFWLQQIPNLKPTAGYPQDAKRFRSQIESRANQLALTPDTWWRSR